MLVMHLQTDPLSYKLITSHRSVLRLRSSFLFWFFSLKVVHCHVDLAAALRKPRDAVIPLLSTTASTASWYQSYAPFLSLEQ